VASRPKVRSYKRIHGVCPLCMSVCPH